MPFTVTIVLDKPAPSETFIQREIEPLRCRNWPIYTCFLHGGHTLLESALGKCPARYRWRFCKAACRRVLEELLHSPLTALRIIRRVPQIAHLIKLSAESGSRLLHAHFAGITADMVAIAAYALEVPWSCSVHAQDVFTVDSRQTRRRLRTAAGVTGCSQKAVDMVLAAGMSGARVVKIHHGLPLTEYPPRTTAPRQSSIFTAARLEAKKGLDTLLSACALLRDRGVEFACEIAGSGTLEADLRRLAQRLGVEKLVTFTGWLTAAETRSCVVAASVVALPSRRLTSGDSDGIANILLEAMALGTTVVTTDAGAATEVVVDGVSGVVVAPDDPAALADALAAVLECATLRANLTRAARRIIEERFDAAVTIQALESFFVKVSGLQSVDAGGGRL